MDLEELRPVLKKLIEAMRAEIEIIRHNNAINHANVIEQRKMIERIDMRRSISNVA
jgi:hypothetical protein